MLSNAVETKSPPFWRVQSILSHFIYICVGVKGWQLCCQDTHIFIDGSHLSGTHAIKFNFMCVFDVAAKVFPAETCVLCQERESVILYSKQMYKKGYNYKQKIIITPLCKEAGKQMGYMSHDTYIYVCICMCVYVCVCGGGGG